ncbi:MAG: response regulator [Devosiaceae bacterium]|nr:response regulator [Devosiaceae bacterium MH13]
MTVIILEDDTAVCDAIATFAKQMGHDVVTFHDAESFFAAMVPTGDDMLIVDIGLPGIDGARVIQWVHALAEPPQVLAITGQSQTAIRDFLEGMPSTNLLRKPLSAVELSHYF